MNAKEKAYDGSYSRNTDRRCPRCHDRWEKDVVARDKAIADGYSTMSPDEWLKFREESELSSYEYGKLDETVMFLLNLQGEFCIRYKCSCRKCSFAFSAEHEQAVPFLETEAIAAANI